MTLNRRAFELLAKTWETPINDHAMSPEDPRRVLRTGFALNFSRRTATYYPHNDVLVLRVPTRHPAWPKEYTTQTYVIDPDLTIRTRINGILNKLVKELNDAAYEELIGDQGVQQVSDDEPE